MGRGDRIPLNQPDTGDRLGRFNKEGPGLNCLANHSVSHMFTVIMRPIMLPYSIVTGVLHRFTRLRNTG